MVQTSHCPRGPFCAFAHVESKYIAGMIFFFRYLIDYSYFPLEKIAKSCWTQSEQVKNGPFERGCGLAAIM
jgi:hypothetical protein